LATKADEENMRPFKPLRTIAVLPTLFTLGNLVCGFFSIVVASRIEAPTSVEAPAAQRIVDRSAMTLRFDPSDDAHNVLLAVVLIFVAMILDALDGQVARLANSTTEFGAELDSLADLVTFGCAPAFLLAKMCPSVTYLHREAVWVIAALYVACAAMRLARFNVETGGDDDDHMQFSGLPSPAAAASVASFSSMFYSLRRSDQTLAYAEQLDTIAQWVLPIFAIALSLLMVSRIPYPHLMNQLFRGQKSFAHVVGLVFALVAVMVQPAFSIPMICMVFVLFAPLRFAWRYWHDARAAKEPLF
jgi:CDP-diacylglycerol---serine O-phosphatidyltransferase